MTNIKERYIISWLHNNGMWVTVCIEETYDVAIQTTNRFKRYDKNRGDEFRYRIVKETIQEEVVYDEL